MVGYESKRIVLFDSDCNLCNSFVNFCIARDPDFNLHFASIQSPVMQTIISNLDPSRNLTGFDKDYFKDTVSDREPTTVFFYENGLLYSKSHAVFRILFHLKGWMRLFRIFKFIPDFISDSLYVVIARYRYKIFGKSNSCRLPHPDEELRFLK